MAKKATMKINAPREVIMELRYKFPKIPDSNLIRIMYNTSLLRLEAGLRKNEKKKKNIFK